MKKQVQAKIYWLSAQEGGRSHLPTGLRYVTVATFNGDNTNETSAVWSFVVESSAPFQQSVWNFVTVGFLNSEDAPQHLLKPGQRFQLREGRRMVATGEIIEAVEEVPRLNGRSFAVEQIATHSSP